MSSQYLLGLTFFKGKSAAVKYFLKLCQKLLNLPCIRSDHCEEFDQLGFDMFCEKYCILHNFLTRHNSQHTKWYDRTKNCPLEDIV